MTYAEPPKPLPVINCINCGAPITLEAIPYEGLDWTHANGDYNCHQEPRKEGYEDVLKIRQQFLGQ